jgi:hypothetical protein
MNSKNRFILFSGIFTFRCVAPLVLQLDAYVFLGGVHRPLVALLVTGFVLFAEGRGVHNKSVAKQLEWEQKELSVKGRWSLDL